MKTKICSNPKCLQPEKPISQFNKSKKGKFGVEAECKSCRKIYRDMNKNRFSLKSKIRYQENKEQIKLTSLEYYHKNINNPEFQNKRQIYRDKNKEKRIQYDKQRYQDNKEEILIKYKEYRDNNKNNINKYFINRRKNDINFRITGNLRIRLWKVLKGISKSKRTLKLLGCTVEELKHHLENQFTKGMSWDNYGLWHMDHIKPCSLFDLSKPSQQRKCFNYKNLQPLWAIDNIRKGNKY